jgi:hypothetical protein
MSEAVNNDRRRFFGTAIMTLAADSHRVLSGIGHNVPQEDPQAFAKAIVDVDGY